MTLFIAEASGTDADALAKARIVKDGFSWPAFVFAQLWLIYRRLWIPLVIWIVLEVAYFALVATHVPVATSVMVDLLAHLYIGFEGNRLRLRRGPAISDVIEARDRDDAEVIFFRRVLGEERV